MLFVTALPTATRMKRLGPLGRCARGNQTLVARPREAQWMRSAHLRVRIIFDRSVVTALMRERRLDHTLWVVFSLYLALFLLNNFY